MLVANPELTLYESKTRSFKLWLNAGYWHPTLAAVANYLVTGLESDQVYFDPLWGLNSLQKDIHELAIYNSIGRHVETLSPYIRGLEWRGLKEGENKLGVISDRKTHLCYRFLRATALYLLQSR